MIWLRKILGYARHYLKWVASGLLPPSFRGLKAVKGIHSERLGSDYGGWVIPGDLIDDSYTLFSAGVGEDISFDIEFAKRFGSKVVFVDPTPRSISYLESFELALKNKEKVFEFLGQKLSIEGLELGHFSRIEKAVWDRKGKMTFYPPKINEHVSFSLSNLQNTDPLSAIEVDVDTVANLCRQADLNPKIVKFDIEGVAASTIIKMLQDGVLPQIILTELEELMSPSEENQKILKQLETALLKHGYSLVARDRIYNFTFVKS